MMREFGQISLIFESFCNFNKFLEKACGKLILNGYRDNSRIFLEITSLM